MKTKILFLLFLLSITAAQAQTTLLGITAGPTQTNVSTEPNNRETMSRSGYTAGITYQHFFRRRFSFGADLLYSQRGFDRNIAYVSGSWRVRSSAFCATNYNYLSLPLKVGVKFGRKFYGFVNVGLVPAILLQSKSDLLAFDANRDFIGVYTETVTNQTSRFDVGGLLELGACARLTKQLRLSVTFAYQSSFSNTEQEYSYDISSVSHSGIGFLVGLQYKLPQRAQSSPEPETNPQ